MVRLSLKVSAALVGGALVFSLASCSQPQSAEDRNAGWCSATVYVRTVNELRDWWDGNSLPITWVAKVEDNRDYDGVTRPDHAPPQGLQGLVQTVESGLHEQPIEYSAMCGPLIDGGSRVGATAEDEKKFELTPTVSIDGQTIALSSIEFANTKRVTPIPYYTDHNSVVFYKCGVPVGKSAKTPRGLLQYEEVLVNCGSESSPNYRNAALVIRNYSR